MAGRAPVPEVSAGALPASGVARFTAVAAADVPAGCRVARGTPCSLCRSCCDSSPDSRLAPVDGKVVALGASSRPGRSPYGGGSQGGGYRTLGGQQRRPTVTHELVESTSVIT